MGRKFRGGRRGDRGGDRKGNGNGGGQRSYTRYPEIVKEHKNLQTYYDTLLQLPDEEKEQFWTVLRRELPNSFRFCGSKGHALAVKRLLQTRYIPEITKIDSFDGQPVEPPQAVPWYPDSLAWSMTTPKNVVRKFPPFAAFQRFLVSETSVGNISRQELVSMIPPLLMDLRPGMTVLDMCAAPGSKSAQLLEMIHRGEESRIRKVMRAMLGDGEIKEDSDEDEAAKLAADPNDDGRATGILIANDSDYKRSHLLVHQLKRLSSPNMMVTNHDATIYPALRILNPEDSDKPAYLKFDRILTDVPCSGDGTLRKNVAIWKDWSAGSALGLHVIQIRILVRALSLLKPGGRVVYSTCSMNPIENEAVIAAAIARCGGSDKVEIVDCSKELPLLKRYPGLKNWKVMDKSNRIWGSWAEVEFFTESSEDKVTPSRLSETMFPDSEGSDAAGLPLERCMRVYAHMQDTGGFFITVLQKKAEFKARPEDTRKQNTNHQKNPRQIRAGLEGTPSGETKPKLDDEGSGVKRAREEEEGEETVNKRVKTADEANGHRGNVETDADVSAIKAEVEPVETITDKGVVKVEDAEQEESKPEAFVNTPPADSEVKEEPSTSNPETPNSEVVLVQRRKKPDGAYEEPFKYLKTDHEVIKDVSDFYGISDRFPKDRYLVRNEMGEPAKAIYYTSALIRDILVMNEGRGVKFIHAGVKMFVKQDAPSAEVCRWRIQSEGMPILHGYIGSNRVVVLKKKATLKRLLVEMFPKITDGDVQELDEIAEQIGAIGMGCCVLRIEPEGDDPDFNEQMALPLWKSFKSLNLMLPKEDRSAMLLRIFNDTTPLVNMGIKKDNQSAEGVVAKEEEDEVKKEEDGEETTAEDVKQEDAETKESFVEESETVKSEEKVADVKTESDK